MRKALPAIEDCPHAGQRSRIARDKTVSMELLEFLSRLISRALFITQRIDRVLTSGAQSRVERSDAAANQPHHERNQDPARFNFDYERSHAHQIGRAHV